MKIAIVIVNFIEIIYKSDRWRLCSRKYNIQNDPGKFAAFQGNRSPIVTHHHLYIFSICVELQYLPLKWYGILINKYRDDINPERRTSSSVVLQVRIKMDASR